MNDLYELEDLRTKVKIIYDFTKALALFTATCLSVAATIGAGAYLFFALN